MRREAARKEEVGKAYHNPNRRRLHIDANERQLRPRRHENDVQDEKRAIQVEISLWEARVEHTEMAANQLKEAFLRLQNQLMCTEAYLGRLEQENSRIRCALADQCRFTDETSRELQQLRSQTRPG